MVMVVDVVAHARAGGPGRKSCERDSPGVEAKTRQDSERVPPSVPPPGLGGRMGKLDRSCTSPPSSSSPPLLPCLSNDPPGSPPRSVLDDGRGASHSLLEVVCRARTKPTLRYLLAGTRPPLAPSVSPVTAWHSFPCSVGGVERRSLAGPSIIHVRPCGPCQDVHILGGGARICLCWGG